MPSAFERRQAAAARRAKVMAVVAVFGVALIGSGVWALLSGQGDEVAVVAPPPAPAIQTALAPAQTPPAAPAQTAAQTPVTQAPAQTSAPAQAASPAPAPAAPAPATQAAVPDKDVPARTLDVRTLADTFGPLLNAARAEEGLGPVAPHTLLEQAALAHAVDMEARDFFDHVAPDGGTLGERVALTGYAYCIVAENIARGQPTVQVVHTAWMNSPGHRANNLVPDITHYGLVLEDDSWVLVLGAEVC